MITAVIVDDEEKDAELIKGFLRRYAAENKDTGDVNVTVFADGAAFIAGLEAGTTVADVVFLDIEMPQLSGMDAARRLRAIDPFTAIVFVTNMAQYALQGYEVNAVDFIVKPVVYEDFALKFRKVLRYVARNAGKTLSLKVGESELVRVNTADILYVEVLGHYLHFHTADGGTVRTRGSMRGIESELIGFPFARASKSYLVNLPHVTCIRNGVISVGGGKRSETVFLGRTRKDEFLQKFYAYLGGLT